MKVCHATRGPALSWRSTVRKFSVHTLWCRPRTYAMFPRGEKGWILRKSHDNLDGGEQARHVCCPCTLPAAIHSLYCLRCFPSQRGATVSLVLAGQRIEPEGITPPGRVETLFFEGREISLPRLPPSAPLLEIRGAHVTAGGTLCAWFRCWKDACRCYTRGRCS